jgi:hypothetical protein
MTTHGHFATGMLTALTIVIPSFGTLLSNPDSESAPGVENHAVVDTAYNTSLLDNTSNSNRLPYAESFETFDLWTTTWLAWGWSSEEWNAARIRPIRYDYAGSLPISGLRHEQVMDVNGPVRHNFTSALSHSHVLVDAMIQPALRTHPSHPPANADAQAAFYFNGNGKLAVFHSIYSGGFTTVSQQWTELNHTAITNGQWVRFKVTCDYLSDSLRGDKYYSVELDGTALTSPNAYNTPQPTNEVADMGGSLFLCANSGNGGGNAALTGLAFDGLMRVDDLTVSTPSSVTAQGTPLEWLESYYPGADLEAVDLLDTDGDGHFAWQEYLAGTDPTDDTSAFIGSIAQLPSGDLEITWPSAFDGSLLPYAVYISTNLTAPDGGWERVEGSILRDVSGVNRWVNPSPPAAPAVFYRPAIQNP